MRTWGTRRLSAEFSIPNLKPPLLSRRKTLPIDLTEVEHADAALGHGRHRRLGEESMKQAEVSCGDAARGLEEARPKLLHSMKAKRAREGWLQWLGNGTTGEQHRVAGVDARLIASRRSLEKKRRLLWRSPRTSCGLARLGNRDRRCGRRVEGGREGS